MLRLDLKKVPSDFLKIKGQELKKGNESPLIDNPSKVNFQLQSNVFLDLMHSRVTINIYFYAYIQSNHNIMQLYPYKKHRETF
jgi:hypothetical protein